MEVSYKGFLLIQDDDYHYMIFNEKSERLVMTASWDKPLSKNEAEKIIDGVTFQLKKYIARDIENTNDYCCINGRLNESTSKQICAISSLRDMKKVGRKL